MVMILYRLLAIGLFRDREGRRDGGGGKGGRDQGGDRSPEQDDMSSSILDMDTNKLYAQVRDTESNGQ